MASQRTAPGGDKDKACGKTGIAEVFDKLKYAEPAKMYLRQDSGFSSRLDRDSGTNIANRISFGFQRQCFWAFDIWESVFNLFER